MFHDGRIWLMQFHELAISASNDGLQTHGEFPSCHLQEMKEGRKKGRREGGVTVTCPPILEKKELMQNSKVCSVFVIFLEFLPDWKAQGSAACSDLH